jgi:hypothetical protein
LESKNAMVGRDDPDGAERAARGFVRLLTLNLGLLGVQPHNGWLVELAAGNPERLRAAPGMLALVDADIVAFQEIYRPADRKFLMQAMASRYPFSAFAPRSRSVLGSGLMLVSRFPILSSEFVSCRRAPQWDAAVLDAGISCRRDRHADRWFNPRDQHPHRG